MSSSTGNSPKSEIFTEHINCDSGNAVKSVLESCRSANVGLLQGAPYQLPPKAKGLQYRFVSLGMKNVIEHFPSDQVLSIETGIKLAELEEYLLQSKQWLPVYSAKSERSLLDFINSGDAGPLEHAFGEARDLILGMTGILGSGEVIKCGGKVVKNVTGYDLPKLFSGSRGIFQIPLSAHLRLYAKPEHSISVLASCKTIDEAFDRANELLNSGLPLSCLELASSGAISKALLKEDVREGRTTEPGAGAAAGTAVGTAVGAAGAGAASICIQLHGMPKIIQTLEQEIKEQFLKVDTESFDGEEQNWFWSHLSFNGQSLDKPVLAICAQRKILRDVLKTAAESEELVSWTARPSKYKAFIEFKELSSLLTFKDALVKSLGGSGQITLSHPSQTHSIYAYQAPNEDMVSKELKRRLRLEYDPSSILNQLVEI